MKNTFICSFFLLFSSFKIAAQNNLIDSVITESILQQHVKVLAHDSMQGRFTGTKGCNNAAEYIATEMESIGLKPFNIVSNNYFQPYKIVGYDEPVLATNVIALLPGKISDRFIIFSAHYDHVGVSNNQFARLHLKKSSKDSIYNGANDNASGVAALLTIAQYFKTIGNNNYSILFIAFSGEEMGLLGSEAFTSSFSLRKNILQVINLEMLGRPRNKKAKPFVTEGINSFGFTKKLNKNYKQINPSITKNFFTTDTNLQENLFFRSDNYSFAIKGIPANTIMLTPATDAFYHSPGDEWQTLNYEAMAEVVKAIAKATMPLIITKLEAIK